MIFLTTVGFVLIIARPRFESEVFEKVKEIEEVEDVVPLFGEYDIIAKVAAMDQNHLGSVVSGKIRMIKGVMDTKTLPVAVIL